LEKIASVYVAIYDRPRTNNAMLSDSEWSTALFVAQSQNGVWLKLTVFSSFNELTFHNIPRLVFYYNS
jgi:hypothetical protein